jgi:hypothetical protein
MSNVVNWNLYLIKILGVMDSAVCVRERERDTVGERRMNEYRVLVEWNSELMDETCPSVFLSGANRILG